MPASLLVLYKASKDTASLKKKSSGLEMKKEKKKYRKFHLEIADYLFLHSKVCE